VYLIKSFTQGSLADGQHSTQRRNVKRGTKVSQGQPLSVLDQVTCATCGPAKRQGRWRVVSRHICTRQAANQDQWLNPARTGAGMILPFGPTCALGGIALCEAPLRRSQVMSFFRERRGCHPDGSDPVTPADHPKPGNAFSTGTCPRRCNLDLETDRILALTAIASRIARLHARPGALRGAGGIAVAGAAFCAWAPAFGAMVKTARRQVSRGLSR